MDFRHLIVTCLFSMLRLSFETQKIKENYAIFLIKSPILRKTIVGDVLFCLEASVGRTVPDNRFACYPRLFLSRPIDIRLIDILSADKKIHIAPFL